MQSKLIVEQNGNVKKFTVENGSNLLSVLLENDFELNTYCGGQGVCGKCKIKIKEGINEATEKEKKYLVDDDIEKGIRLACMTTIKNDMNIKLEDTEEIDILTSGIITKTDINIDLKKETINLEKPTIKDQRDFLKRIYDKQLDAKNIKYSSLKDLNKINKNKEFTLTSFKNTITQIEEGNTINNFYGLAIDIGTTTIVIYLINLNTGEEIDIYSLYNPQKKYGADVISRVNYTIKNKDGVKKMKKVLIDGLNNGIENLIENNDMNLNDILSTSIVGNTIMMHTLTGIDTESIAKSPYIPLFTDPMEFNPNDLGIKINKNGIIFLLPSISGYVGADIIGDMLAVDFDSYTDDYNLMIDIGTNGEIVLGNGEKIFACSAAAGPAFEGANITYGMAGISGAVSEFKIDDNHHVKYKTVNNKNPKGICGSGLLDIIAELKRHNFINSTGAFVIEEDMEDWQKNMMTKYKDNRSFIVVDSETTEADNKCIVLTQKDIREVQLAKGAIAAGIEILKQEADISNENINRVFLAGGFGNYIDPHNACEITMIPKDLEEKIIQIGNGAGTGARLYLLNKKYKNIAKKLLNKTSYIELSTNLKFQNEYINNMNFN